MRTMAADAAHDASKTELDRETWRAGLDELAPEAMTRDGRLCGGEGAL
jgi:hypothetical protein